MRRRVIARLPTEFQANQGEIISRKFDFEVITPVIGGDAQSWKLDTQNPVRGQSVKGQLRFWWRTMQDQRVVKQLLYRENSLWGGKIADEGADNRMKSPVSLSITDQTIAGEDLETATMKSKYAVDDRSIPGYVLFPITPMVKDGEKVHIIKKMSFSLNISFPRKFQDEVLNTLKLWILFGGVGARTRRGTGSLYCHELLADFDTPGDILAFTRRIGGENDEQMSYPRLCGSSLFMNRCKSDARPGAEWFSLLSSYGSFRQDRVPGKRPGRSYWPEPDAIRLITGVYSKHTPVHPDNKWFPRAAFGLPILSRFNNMDGQGDPRGDFNLQPDIGTGERFPSPLILKVIRLPNGSVWRTCLVLSQIFPERMVLKYSSGVYRLEQEEIPRQGNYPDMIMKTNDHLNGRSIYRALADKLELGEVT